MAMVPVRVQGLGATREPRIIFIATPRLFFFCVCVCASLSLFLPLSRAFYLMSDETHPFFSSFRSKPAVSLSLSKKRKLELQPDHGKVVLCCLLQINLARS